MTSTFSQLFPPKPEFTESSLGDLRGKIFIVTGSTSGVGLELAKILYSRNATVWISGRSDRSVSGAIEEIKLSTKRKQTSGKLESLVMDLSSLSSVQAGARKFLAVEQQLHVLFHNAGVMTPPANSKSSDGYDLELATNCLAPFLFTKLMQPTLERTAAQSGGVRVVFVCSLMNMGVPEGGILWEGKGSVKQLAGMDNYMQSKAGGLFLSREFSKRLGAGAASVACHPGLMKTNLQRNSPPPQRAIMSLIFKGPKHGAYTELYAGLAADVQNGKFYIPWGRSGDLPEHLETAMSGAASSSEKFYEWCEQQTAQYL